MPKYICTKCGRTFANWDELSHEVDCPDCMVPVECIDKAFQRAFLTKLLEDAPPATRTMWREFQCMALTIRPVCITVNFNAPDGIETEA